MYTLVSNSESTIFSSVHWQQQQQQNKQRRPPAKAFNEEDIRAIGGEVTTQGSFKIFESNEYNARGFLIKTFYPSAFISEGVKPTLAELSRFEDKPESVSLDCKYCRAVTLLLSGYCRDKLCDFVLVS